MTKQSTKKSLCLPMKAGVINCPSFFKTEEISGMGDFQVLALGKYEANWNELLT